MPTYDYRCDACGHEFELFQSMTAPVKRKCPSCAKNKLQRLIGTGAGVIFKGSGFYETDYRSESYKKAAESETKPASDTAKSDSTAGESKSSDQKKSDAPASTDKKASTDGSAGGSTAPKKQTKRSPKKKSS